MAAKASGLTGLKTHGREVEAKRVHMQKAGAAKLKCRLGTQKIDKLLTEN